MLQAEQATGIFGKLPAHGDFIHRNLPSRVVNLWDEWLQGFVASTQERLGEAWLDIYLTSPIWRFCLSSGVIDEHQWAGILLPSVDRVGRYFPFSVIHKIKGECNPAEFVDIQQAWYEQIEASALKALEGYLQTDALVEELNTLKPNAASAYVSSGSEGRRGSVDAGLVVDVDFEQGSNLSTMPHLLDAFIKSSFNSYSVWQTAGSDRVEPCVFVSPGMPAVSGAGAMLDGLWEHWEWAVPVRLKA